MVTSDSLVGFTYPKPSWGEVFHCFHPAWNGKVGWLHPRDGAIATGDGKWLDARHAVVALMLNRYRSSRFREDKQVLIYMIPDI